METKTIIIKVDISDRCSLDDINKILDLWENLYQERFGSGYNVICMRKNDHIEMI